MLLALHHHPISLASDGETLRQSPLTLKGLPRGSEPRPQSLLAAQGISGSINGFTQAPETENGRLAGLGGEPFSHLPFWPPRSLRTPAAGDLRVGQALHLLLTKLMEGTSQVSHKGYRRRGLQAEGSSAEAQSRESMGFEGTKTSQRSVLWFLPAWQQLPCA